MLIRSPCAVITAVLFLATSAGLQAVDEERTSPAGPADLVLELDPGKETFVLYEPLVLVYRVVNPTRHEIRSKVVMPAPIGLELTLRHEGDSPRGFGGGLGCVIPPDEETRHAPREVMEDSVTEEVAFPEVGLYTIEGRLFVGNSPDTIWIYAEPVTIQVIEPGTSEQRFIDEVGSPSRLLDLMRWAPEGYCGDEPTQECLDVVADLARDHAHSVYAPAVLYHLASRYGWRGAGHEPRHDLEVELLEEFLTRWPDHRLAPAVMYTLVFALREVGQKAEAMALLGRFEDAYPLRRRVHRSLHGEILGVMPPD